MRVNSPCWAYKVSDYAIAQNGSVAAFFFFPLIQFDYSEKKTTFMVTITAIIIETFLQKMIFFDFFLLQNKNSDL